MPRRIPAAVLILCLLLIPTSAGFSASVPPGCSGAFASPAPDPGDGNLTGRVVDAVSRQPVRATVEAVSRQALWVGGTSEAGYFSLYLPPGRYTVRVIATGYAPLSRGVNLARGRATKVALMLRRLSPAEASASGPSRQPSDACSARVQPPTAAPRTPGPSSAEPPTPQGEMRIETGTPGTGTPPAGGGTGGGGTSGGGPVSSGNGSSTSGDGTTVTVPAGPAPESAPGAGAAAGGGETTNFAGTLVHLRTAFTGHGNAARLAWSDDGRTIFLANEEGVMSAVRIDASDPARLKLAGSQGEVNFLWGVAQRSGLLVFNPSLGDVVVRIDPSTFATRWSATVGQSHALATDGSRVFVPVEGKPGTLVTVSSDGQVLSRIEEPDGWHGVYSAVYDETTKRLYVGAGDNPGGGYPGGAYIYDVSGTPVKIGEISGPSWDITARGRWLWRGAGANVEAWDLSDPGRPALAGMWAGQTERGPGGTLVRPQVGHMITRQDGTRLYVSYRYVTAAEGHQVLDWHAGFMTFNVTGGTPVLVHRQGWKTDVGAWVQPTSLALSPNQSLLAVSYWAFGVRVYRVSGDTDAPLGMVATTGEAHDVYVDGDGYLYVFANDDIQIMDPATGAQVGVYVTGTGFDGQWRPFKDGTIILPSARNNHSRLALRMAGGAVTLVGTVPAPASSWDEVFEDPYLYSATDRGLHVQRIGALDAATKIYAVSTVGSLDLGGPLLAIVKWRNVIWGTGPTVGVVAIDVSTPSAPRLVFQDRFSYGTNGSHAGMAAARGRIYAGAGDAGLIVYNAAGMRRTGAVTGLNVNFLDLVGEDFLVVANYWFTQILEGMVLYDLRPNPDTPRQLLIYPGDATNANFRARVAGNKIYRVPLYGVDVLEIR